MAMEPESVGAQYTETVDITHHRELLSKLCRICGKLIDIRAHSVSPKTRFVEEIKSLFDIDVTNESEDIFPSHVCFTHEGLLYRFRRCSKESKPFTTAVDTMYDFKEHTDDCRICTVVIESSDGGHDYAKPKAKGRPRKKKRHYFEKGSIHVEPVIDTHEGNCHFIQAICWFI